MQAEAKIQQRMCGYRVPSIGGEAAAFALPPHSRPKPLKIIRNLKFPAIQAADFVDNPGQIADWCDLRRAAVLNDLSRLPRSKRHLVGSSPDRTAERRSNPIRLGHWI